MKKLFVLVIFLISFQIVKAQYTYIAQRYEWYAGLFRGLGVPAGAGPAAFIAGQAQRAGSLYYDSVGVDSGLYVWSGLAWRQDGGYTDADARAAISLTTIGIDGLSTYNPTTGVFNIPDYTTTASEGNTKVGSDFQLGGAVTTDRSITLNNDRFDIVKTKAALAPFQFFSLDTLNASTNFSGLYNDRTIEIPTFGTTSYGLGAQFSMRYHIKDRAAVATVGGDFGAANKSTIVLGKMSGYIGQSLFNGGTSFYESVPTHINDLTFGGSSTTSNYKYATGYWTGTNSYLVLPARDTIENWVGFHNMGFIVANSHVKYSYDYIGGYFGVQSAAIVDKPWFLYNYAPRSQSYLAGSLGVGDSVIHASTIIDAKSTTKGVVWPRMTTVQKDAIASPATGLIVFDTDLVQYNFWDGDSWEAMGGGGGAAQNLSYNSGTHAIDIDGGGTSAVIPLANTSTTGLITDTDWDTFNGKIAGALTAPRIPFATGAATVGDSDSLQWAASAVKVSSGTSNTQILGTGVINLNHVSNTLSLTFGSGLSGTSRLYNANVPHSFGISGSQRFAILSTRLISDGYLDMKEQTAPGTPASTYVSVYPKSDGRVYAKDDAGVELKLSNPTLTKHANIIDPLSTDDRFVFSTDVAITITSVKAVLVGSSTPSVTYNITFDADRSAAGTNVFTAGQTVTSTTTMTAASGVNDATIPAGSIVRVKLSAVSGTVGEMDVSITYTED